MPCRFVKSLISAFCFTVFCCSFGVDARTPLNLQGGIIAPHESISLETTSKTIDMLNRFEERFAVMDSVIFNIPIGRSDSLPSSLDSAAFKFVTSERVDAVDKVVNARISEMKNKTGLDVKGQIYVRPGNGTSYDPDDPLVAYNAKVQAELEWNIFHSSIYKRASKIKELQLEGELRQLNYVRDGLNETILLQKKTMRDRHYGRMLSVLNLHAENVQLLMETQLYLLEHGKISSDDLLRLISEQSEIERQLIAIKADSVITELPPNIGVTYISVTDTAGIFRSINDNNLELKKLGIRYDLLGVQRHNVDYVQTMDIMPFVRYSYYNRENVHNTYNLDVGVSFKIPISAEVKKKRNAITAEQGVVLYEQQQLEDETAKEIYLVFKEFENLNENIRGEFLRMQSLRKYIEMRTDSYGKVDGEYSRINRLQEYNVYLQAWERLLDYSYRRDTKIVELQSYLLNEPISKFLRFEELE